MKRSHSALTIASALLIAIGVGTTGYAGFEILGMNSNLGGQYLPKLESSLIASDHKEAAVALLPQPKIGDVIGEIFIPKMKSIIPIIEGTGTKELKRGVGHYVGSVLPGFSDNSVLAGHRDSVFRKLGDLEIGDRITIRSDYGYFIYEVHKIRIVSANDRTVIVPSQDAVLTLSTCYPFRFIGNAPKRYIVQAGLIIGEPVA